MPAALSVLLEGNAEALAGFSKAEEQQLEVLLKRLIANLDRIASA